MLVDSKEQFDKVVQVIRPVGNMRAGRQVIPDAAGETRRGASPSLPAAAARAILERRQPANCPASAGLSLFKARTAAPRMG